LADKKLTAKQKMFVHEYLVDLNATQAAIRAGYSDKTAEVIGFENLRKPNVEKAIQKAMDERAKRVDVTAERVLQELAHIAYDDIKNYLSYRTEKTLLEYDENGKPIIGYKQIIEMMDSDMVDTRNIQEVSINAKGDFKFKLYSKSDALVNLGRHLGLFTDKSEVSMTVSVEDYLKTLDDDDDDD
jgi:phage terminase small subunit